MYQFKYYTHKDLFGLIYTFPNRGDGIKMHDHPEDQKHNVTMLQGSCEVYGPDRKWSVTLQAGDIFNLEDEHHPHEIVALEANTRILGLNVHGKPSNFVLADNPPEGTINRPLVHPLDPVP